MIKEALQYFQSLCMQDTFIPCRNKVAIKKGDSYEVMDTKDEFKGQPYNFTTLDGFIEYVKHYQGFDKNADDYPAEREILIKITSPTQVDMYLGINLNRTRMRMATSNPIIYPKYAFGNKYTLNEFIIWLQTGFFLSNERDLLISKISKVSATSTLTLADDGITQQAEIKQGVHLSEREGLPAIIDLTPIRTFHEQGLCKVASPFLLRVDKKDDSIVFALHEADGQAWQTRQIQEIRTYIDGHLNHMPNVRVLA